MAKAKAKAYTPAKITATIPVEKYSRIKKQLLNAAASEESGLLRDEVRRLRVFPLVSISFHNFSAYPEAM